MFKIKISISVRLLYILTNIKRPSRAVKGNEIWLIVSLEVLLPQKGAFPVIPLHRLKKCCCF